MTAPAMSPAPSFFGSSQSDYGVGAAAFDILEHRDIRWPGSPLGGDRDRAAGTVAACRLLVLVQGELIWRDAY
jgi:hypothetical protein